MRSETLKTAVICTVLVFLAVSSSYSQINRTVIPNNFSEYDLFELSQEGQWHYLSGSAGYELTQVLSKVDQFHIPNAPVASGGWWLLALTNKSDVESFGLKFSREMRGDITVYQVSDGQVASIDSLGFSVKDGNRETLMRLLVSGLNIEKDETSLILIKDWPLRTPPNTKLGAFEEVKAYSDAYERMSLIFTIILAFILIYQIGTLILIPSVSYRYYCILAFGYLLHAFNTQIDGWTTMIFADNLSIVSALIVCVGGLLLWKRFLSIDKGFWFGVYRLLSVMAYADLAFVLGYIFIPYVPSDFNFYATNIAALTAFSILLTWVITSIQFYYTKHENARYYLLTNVPIFIGGFVFIGIWFAIEYDLVRNLGVLPLLSNYIFFSTAVLQLLLFALVIGFAIKKKLVGSYHSERDKKIELEERVKDRTAELIKINEELLTKNEELKKINGTKNRLLTILSHDLRSPINNVASLITLLKEHQFSQAEFSALIPELEKSINDTSSFMSLLVSWTQSQNDGLKPSISDFHLRELIDRNLDLLKQNIEEKSLDVVLKPADCLVTADKNMIDLVIRNLLTNAVKFSHPGGRINLTCSKVSDSHIKIEIQDFGVGIDETRIEVLFDVAQKNSTVGTSGEKGFGMGLILCQDFIKLNGGGLTFESEKGKGSTFSILIPSKELVATNPA